MGCVFQSGREYETDYAYCGGTDWKKPPEGNPGGSVYKMGATKKTYHFGRDELVIFGIPVYAGRVPNKILPDIEKGFRGDDTPLIPISVYGNRNFDDALMELKMVLEDRGFHSVAAAAVTSRHVFSNSLAAGRPDADDMQDFVNLP